MYSETVNKSILGESKPSKDELYGCVMMEDEEGQKDLNTGIKARQEERAGKRIQP